MNITTHNLINANVTGPRGAYIDGRQWEDETTGAVGLSLELCGASNEPGRYTLTVDVQGYDENYENPTEVTATKTFTFTKVDSRARSAITKKVRNAYGRFTWKGVRLPRKPHHEADCVGRVPDSAPDRTAAGAGRPGIRGLLATTGIGSRCAASCWWAILGLNQ